MFLGVKCDLFVGLTALPPYMRRMSRQCGILNISQPYRPRSPVTRIDFLTSYMRKSYACKIFVFVYKCTYIFFSEVLEKKNIFAAVKSTSATP
jgi:hypothetical protein